MRTASFPVLNIVFAIGLAGCSSGGSTNAVPASITVAAPAATATSGFTPPAAGSPNPSSGLTLTAVGGLQGTAYRAHAAGSDWDYAEDVALDFDQAVSLSSFNSSYTISPAAASSAYTLNSGTRIGMTIRKVPGVKYVVTLAPTLASATSRQLGTAVTFAVETSANVSLQAPLQSTLGQPYRYGVLEHPFPDSLAASTAAQQISLLAAAGARFARIDYLGAQSELVKGVFDFSIEDKILDQLAAKGMTELPIIVQYNAPSWSNGGQAYPATWSQPSDYAAFAAAVASHLSLKYPQVTRVELFNEPNEGGWWSNPNPQYAATDGSATAAYMRAAYAAIKAVNPNLVVVGPSLTDGGAVDARTFLTNMYAAGCRTGSCWDVLSVHNYAWTDPNYAQSTSTQARWSVYQDLQSIAVAHGDSKPHVMLTEWGFSTYNQSTGFDPQVQARLISHGFNAMLADPTVDGIVYVNLYNAGTDFWGRTALTNPDFSLQPAFSTYQTFSAR